LKTKKGIKNLTFIENNDIQRMHSVIFIRHINAPTYFGPLGHLQGVFYTIKHDLMIKQYAVTIKHDMVINKMWSGRLIKVKMFLKWSQGETLDPVRFVS
jgi:hypothetical protein